MAGESVTVAALDGVWESLGADRFPGILPEALQLNANEWGPDTASFTLRRTPGKPFPDLLPFTPLEVERAGLLGWSGFIDEVSGDDGDGAVNVQAKGWQYHLDDDLIRRLWVHMKLTDWQDFRSNLAATLTTYTAGCQVEVGDGAMVLTYPNGTPAQGGGMVYFDAGPGQTIQRVVIDWAITAFGGNRAVYFLSGNTIAELDGGVTVSNIVAPAAGGAASSGTFPLTLATPARYIGIRLDSNSHTPAADESVRITRALLFSSTAYESGGASALTLDTLIKDIRDRGAPLLSTDNSRIGTFSFAIPDMDPRERRTPRELMAIGQAFHDARLQVDVDKKVVAQLRPSAPLFEVGEWTRREFKDASVSGASIANGVIVEGKGADGQQVEVERSASYLRQFPMAATNSPRPQNPSFETDASTWSPAPGGTITRDTGVFDSGVASGRWNPPGGTAQINEYFTGTLLAGIPHMLVARLKGTAANVVQTYFGGLILAEQVNVGVSFSGGWDTVVLIWTPAHNYVNAEATFLIKTTNNNAIYIDSLQLFVPEPTLVDRRSFKKRMSMPVDSSLTAALGQQLGDVYLNNHMLAPFKGEQVVQGWGDVRMVLGGRAVHPFELLRNTEELLRFSDRVDPDTGGHGRDGRMKTVSYSAESEEASIGIDNESRRLEALLARLAVVNG